MAFYTTTPQSQEEPIVRLSLKQDSSFGAVEGKVSIQAKDANGRTWTILTFEGSKVHRVGFIDKLGTGLPIGADGKLIID